RGGEAGEASTVPLAGSGGQLTRPVALLVLLARAAGARIVAAHPRPFALDGLLGCGGRGLLPAGLRGRPIVGLGELLPALLLGHLLPEALRLLGHALGH